MILFYFYIVINQANGCFKACLCVMSVFLVRVSVDALQCRTQGNTMRAAPRKHEPLEQEGLTRSRARDARGQRQQRPRRAPPIHLTPSSATITQSNQLLSPRIIATYTVVTRSQLLCGEYFTKQFHCTSADVS